MPSENDEASPNMFRLLTMFRDGDKMPLVKACSAVIGDRVNHVLSSCVVDRADLTQEAFMILQQAAQDFDPNAGAAFKTFLRHRLLRLHDCVRLGANSLTTDSEGEPEQVAGLESIVAAVNDSVAMDLPCRGLKGVVCLACGAEAKTVQVHKSRHVESVERRRRCVNCKAEFVTHETARYVVNPDDVKPGRNQTAHEWIREAAGNESIGRNAADALFMLYAGVPLVDVADAVGIRRGSLPLTVTETIHKLREHCGRLDNAMVS